MAKNRTSRLLAPRSDWLHFGCPTCGDVMTLPADPGERPWCLHNGGHSYSWRAPAAGTQASDRAWTLMVPVTVTITAATRPKAVVSESQQPVSEPPAYESVTWNGDGSYTPTCSDCDWQGKPRQLHSAAVSAVRSHRVGRRHAHSRDLARA
jgi:hypothetical protein